jgi:hypothetical protein
MTSNSNDSIEIPTKVKTSSFSIEKILGSNKTPLKQNSQQLSEEELFNEDEKNVEVEKPSPEFDSDRYSHVILPAFEETSAFKSLDRELNNRLGQNLVNKLQSSFAAQAPMHFHPSSVMGSLFGPFSNGVLATNSNPLSFVNHHHPSMIGNIHNNHARLNPATNHHFHHHMSQMNAVLQPHSQHNGNQSQQHHVPPQGLLVKPKKKRSRAAFSHAQVLELEKRFNFQRYLSGPERADLASSLKVNRAFLIFVLVREVHIYINLIRSFS